jgi:vitamin B12 transporter
MRNILIPSAISIAVVSSFSLQAQETGHELDPVTITGSVSPERSSRTGRNLFVIKGEKMLGLPVHSIDELLRYLPGLEIQARGPMGSQSDIVIRGGTFQQVLVVLDGIRLNDPNTGHFSSYIPIAPGEIDRIEVLKGASSAIYGSEAVGGVIHIITKTFAAKKGISKSQAGLQASAGQYGFLSLNAGSFYSNGKTSVSAGLLSNNTSGQQQRGTRGSVYAHTASFSLAQHLGERWQIMMRYAYDKRNFSAQNFYTSFLSDTAKEKVTTLWTQLGLSYQSLKNRLSLQVGYKDLQDEYRFNPVSIPNENNSKLIQALLTDEWVLKPGMLLTSGTQVISKRIVSNDRGDHEITQAAAFVMLNQQLGKRFFMSPAFRVEWNQIAGWELVPQFNASYRLDQMQLRGSVGRTIRDADFTERYNNYQKLWVTGGRVGNPDLEAEKSISYEAGADYFAGKSVKISGTFFQRYHRDLIDYVPTAFADMPRQFNLSPTGNFALAKNISKVTTTGAEAELQLTKNLGREQQIWATLGLTWLQSKSSSSTPSFYISSHARFLSTFQVSYSAARYSISVNGLYKDRKAEKPSVSIAAVSKNYFLMNLKMEAFSRNKKFGIFGQVDNLFDKKYADLLGAPMPGRWLMGGFKISLSK